MPRAAKKSSKPQVTTENAVTAIKHAAKRKNIPPAGLEAQGVVQEAPKIRYEYNPHLPPILRSANMSRRVLVKVAEAHTGLYCGKIVGEYLEKLVDGNHPKDRALRLITYLMGAFQEVSVTTKATPHPPADPDDEIFSVCALDGNADYLVSEDGALLALTPHYSKPIIGCCGDVATPLGA